MVCLGLFEAFDENCDGQLDLAEMVRAVGWSCRSSPREKHNCKSMCSCLCNSLALLEMLRVYACFFLHVYVTKSCYILFIPLACNYLSLTPHSFFLSSSPSSLCTFPPSPSLLSHSMFQDIWRGQRWSLVAGGADWSHHSPPDYSQRELWGNSRGYWGHSQFLWYRSFL